MSNINPNMFRAYDIRGVYPGEINEDAVGRVAEAYSFFYSRLKKIVVACDTRKSSPSLTDALIKALVNSGKDVINLGTAPDPLFFFSILHYHYDGGIMISGSHNPKDQNGMMLYVRPPGKELGADVIGEELVKIKNWILEDNVLSKPQERGTVTDFNPAEQYKEYVTSRIKLKQPLKIIIDSSNGACGYLPEKIFRKLGCHVETIYGEFNGDFPHHLPDPYEEKNLQDLRKTVLEKKADIGFAYDTDGDRVGVIDNKGRVVNGDICLLMLARQALKNKKGPIVHDMRISKAFLDEMEKQGIKTYFSVSHHSAIIQKIVETNAIFGGETTLHFLFPLDYYLCDEAIFASLKLAEIASLFDDFAGYIDSLPSYFTSPEIFIDSTDEEKFNIIEKLQKHLKENKYDFIDIDGARINFRHGWALARAANTAPIIKCRFEGDTKEHLTEIEKESLVLFKKIGIPITKKTERELGL